MKINIGGSGGSELLIDYQDGVNFTVIVNNEQFDFGIEPHEWEVLKSFLDNQRAAEQTAIDGGALGEGER